jgi:hypothetical protein
VKIELREGEIVELPTRDDPPEALQAPKVLADGGDFL